MIRCAIRSLMGGHRGNLEVSFETGNTVVSWSVMVRSQHPLWCQLPLVMHKTLRSGTFPDIAYFITRHCRHPHFSKVMGTLCQFASLSWSVMTGGPLNAHASVLSTINKWLENISVVHFLMLFPRLFHTLAVAHVKWVSAEEEAWT